MTRELTRAEYRRATQTPGRRFQALVIGKAGLTLRGRVASPCYWFERSDVGEEHGTGRYLRIPYLATLSLVVDGKTSAFFYLAGRRLDTCTFAYDLTPSQVSKAVVAMKRAKLQRLVIPAAEWAMREMPDRRRPVLEKALRSLLRARGSKEAASRRRRRTTTVKQTKPPMARMARSSLLISVGQTPALRSKHETSSLLRCDEPRRIRRRPEG
jgi:hypothetical protein